MPVADSTISMTARLRSRALTLSLTMRRVVRARFSLRQAKQEILRCSVNLSIERAGEDSESCRQAAVTPNTIDLSVW